MTTNTLKAWVLHKQRSGETSARLTVLTRDLGMIRATFKGARTSKKQAVIQPFVPLWVTFDERHGHYFIRSAETSDLALPLAGDGLFSGLYVNELLYFILNSVVSDPVVFDAYEETVFGLAQVSERVKIEGLLRRFEWTVLKAAGYSFSLTHTELGEEILAERVYRFIAGRGFIEAKTGFRGGDILALAQNELDEPSYRKTAKLMMRQAIDHVLGGRELISRSLYLNSTGLGKNSEVEVKSCSNNCNGA